MDPATLARLRSHLKSLNEDALRALILEFYICQGVAAAIVHGTGEHGIDVLAHVDRDKDFLGRGYNLLVQVKKGDLTLPRWRDKVLGQLGEAAYYRPSHHLYMERHGRRLILLVAGSTTGPARDSIHQFNTQHEVVVEIWELDQLITLFDEAGFASSLLERITEVGTPIERGEAGSAVPVIGEGPEGAEWAPTAVGEESEETLGGE